MKWFRLHTEARTDRKLDTLTDAEFRVWFNLLCLSAEQPERGTIAFDDEEILALEVAKGDVELLQRTITTLTRLRIVSRDVTPRHAGTGVTRVTDVTSKITFLNWRKRQYDKPSAEPENTRLRKAKSRATPPHSETVTPTSRDVTPRHATYTDTDTDTEKKETLADASEKKTATASQRAPRKFRLPIDWSPSEDNRAFARDRGLSDAEIDAEADKFRDHFTGINPEARPGWDASWRKWIQRELDRPRSNVRPLNGKRFNRDGSEYVDFAAMAAELKAQGR